LRDEFVDDGAYGFSRGFCSASYLFVVGFADVDGDAGQFNIYLKSTLCPHKIVDGELARLLHICSLLHAVIIRSADVLLVQYVTLTEDSRMHATEKRAAGATTHADAKGRLVEFLWYMKKQGYAQSTMRSRVKLLKRLITLGANLYDAEDVKMVIAEQSWCPGRKSNACDAYATFLRMIGGTWDKPVYKSIPKLPFIPQESEIDQLIAACSPRIAAFLQLLKETGMRPGEAWQLAWTDLDTVTRTLRVTPKKGSNPRIFHISAKLAAMLGSLPRAYGDRVFATPPMRLRHHRGSFAAQRKRIAHKLKNPRIQRIMFKTFRHWKGTMEYHRTKDILHVKQVLGHVNIKNTLIYITLAKELFKDLQEYVSKVAHNVKEACELVDVGFEFVTGEYNDGGKIFRKPKYHA